MTESRGDSSIVRLPFSRAATSPSASIWSFSISGGIMQLRRVRRVLASNLGDSLFRQAWKSSSRTSSIWRCRMRASPIPEEERHSESRGSSSISVVRVRLSRSFLMLLRKVLWIRRSSSRYLPASAMCSKLSTVCPAKSSRALL